MTNRLKCHGPRLPAHMLRKLERARDAASLQRVSFGLPTESVIDPKTQHRVTVDSFIKKAIHAHNANSLLPDLDALIRWAKNISEEPDRLVTVNANLTEPVEAPTS